MAASLVPKAPCSSCTPEPRPPLLPRPAAQFFSLLTFVGAGPFVGSRASFASTFVKPIARAQDGASDGREASRADKEFAAAKLLELSRRLETVMLRRGAEINEKSLPPLVSLVIVVRLTPL